MHSRTPLTPPRRVYCHPVGSEVGARHQSLISARGRLRLVVGARGRNPPPQPQSPLTLNQQECTSEAWDPLQPTPSKRAAEHAALEFGVVIHICLHSRTPFAGTQCFGGAVHATGVNSEDDEILRDGVGAPVAGTAPPDEP